MKVNRPAARRDDQLILEGIVTTRNDDDTVNVSPMGPVVDRAVTSLRLRPFQTSTTYKNLLRTKQGVFHVTDDVELLARAAIGRLAPPKMLEADTSQEAFQGLILAGACRWYAFQVEACDDSTERVEIECRVVKQGRIRDFLGWNRAMHAVLEAAILATRIDFLSAGEIQTQLEALSIIVDKTASEHERSAFHTIAQFVASK